MKKILITGGAGFIGSSLADKLLASDYYVVIVDNLLTGDKRNIPVSKNCRFIRCDINNYQDIAPIMAAFQFEYVFHYAAVVGVQRTIDNPVMVLSDLDGFRNILDLSKNTGVKRVFFSSSSEVYGEPVELPQHEHTTPLNSRLPYAIVKNVGEAFCRSYQQQFDLDYTILRFFNTYGIRQSTDFVISKFMRQAIKNEPITIYGDGSQTRTFCYIDDNLDITLKALEQNLFVNDIVNIGSNRITPILELAQKIIEVTESSSEIIHLSPLKEGDMTRRQPDNSKMLSVLGRDLMPLEKGLKSVFESGRFQG